MAEAYDALLVLSFGGPEQREDVIPFLENVLRGRNVPRERMLEVAEHYYHFGGRSPINDQNRALIEALASELSDLDLPVYWGNRNWHPFLADTLRKMTAVGIRRALVFVTSAFGSYSGCRQYLEDMQRARAEVPGAPLLEKIRAFYNHPGFIETMVDRTRSALEEIPGPRRTSAEVVFTAHSIPLSMAASSPYVDQLRESCTAVACGAGVERWRMAYQSRSGPPTQPWLEPDILETLRTLQAAGQRDIVVTPIGFISDHMEVLYDLDTEARTTAEQLGLNLVRAATPGAHPRFIKMIRELVLERLSGHPMGPPASRFQCGSETCCTPPGRPADRRPSPTAS